MWPISQRIGYLLENKDLWWEISEASDVVRVSAAIVATYRHPILAFFDSYQNLATINDAVDHFKLYGDVPGMFDSQVPVIRAIIHSIWGEREAASS